jgi:hypothetical protein
MSTPVYKGHFTGLFHNRKREQHGTLVFSDMYWSYIKIEDCKEVKDFVIHDHKTGDYWFAERIRTRSYLPWQRKTDVFIPVHSDKFHSGNIHNVLLRNIRIDKEKSYFIAQDWEEATGDAFFQLREPGKDVGGTSNQQGGPSTVTGTNVLNNTPTTQKLNIGTGSDLGIWARRIGILLLLLLLFAIGYLLWQHTLLLGVLFLGLVFSRAILGFIGRFPKLGRLIELLIALLVVYSMYLYVYPMGLGSGPVKTKDGSIEITPLDSVPSKNPDDTSGGLSQKVISWFDFEGKPYKARYGTYMGVFRESAADQRSLFESISSQSKDPYQSLVRFHHGMYRMDRGKLDSIVSIFADSARDMGLSPLSTAEMVVSFVQEIPYCLVHDGSCASVIKESDPFVVQYHREGKACLPGIVGGIQSPYAFAHNLKGDCDTRTLLAHTILSRLNIASSVWVSETYAHSILGVGVPAGLGMFKVVDGTRHYGVELTAKGYRVGMVQPSHAMPSNWEVTIYNNPS